MIRLSRSDMIATFARFWRGRWRPLTAAFLLASLLAGCVVYPAYGPPHPRYYERPYYGYYGY
ncbi:MAG TPA: hypothetical protein VMF53_05580 [Alphaproteobacteria bacterium]|nr:hypothetical protein [Alphaproteobacteria bacterium]